MFQIDPLARTPVYEQLIEQLERFIRSGVIRPGDKIPSVRSLSIELSVNPNTVQKAFSQLMTRQIIYSVPGKGNFVSDDALELLNTNSLKKLDELKSIILELKLAGMSKEQLITKIGEYYD